MKSLKSFVPYQIMYVDGMNLMSRSYHGMHDMTYLGKPTGMLFGVARLVLDWAFRNAGVRVVVVWEGRASWRKRAYPIYKANRAYRNNTEEQMTFYAQVDYIREVLPTMGVDQVWAETFEADDVVHELAIHNYDLRQLFVSTDWDWWPLYGYGDILYGRDILVHDDMRSMFAKKYKTDPIDMNRLWVFKLLTGDPSDNVSGIPRFPKKLAVRLANSSRVILPESIPVMLDEWGETLWAERVRSNGWIIERNRVLLSPAHVPSDAFIWELGCYDRSAFGDTLIKGGMEMLYDRLMRVTQ